jgi:hypothetical protein
MIDSSRSIQSPYENILARQILCFFGINLLFFQLGKNHYFWTNQNSQIKLFFLHPKNRKLILKNIKFNLLIYFHIKFKLNGLN